MKRGQTDLNFLIGINKPCGMTSHDVVNKIRKITGEGRVGHMGTLDPMATGVLLVGIGSAARLNNYLEGQDKTYIATIKFGQATNTYDTQGQVTQSFTVPEKINDQKFAIDYLKKLEGVHQQTPPPFSAIKINGQPAYKAARSGLEVNIDSREIEIYKAELVSVMSDSWKVRLAVSKGTYIRSIAHDIGRDLSCGACLSALERESVGNVSLDQCYSLTDFENDFASGSYKILNAVQILDMQIVNADEKMLKRINNGRSLGMNAQWNLFPGSEIALCYDDSLLAIYRADTLVDLTCQAKFSGPIKVKN